MGKSWKDKEIWISAVLSLFLSGIYLLAIHDKQMADGIGLYIAGKMGKSSRTAFDYSADITRFFMLFCVILLPVLLRHRGIKAVFRLLSAYLAFMPFADSVFWVHFLFDGMENGKKLLQYRESIIATISGGMDMVIFAVIPALFLLLFFCNRGKWKELLNVRNIILFGAAVLSLVLLMALPGFREIWIWLFCYSFLLITYECWENGLQKIKSKRIWIWCLFGLCYIRALLRMVQILSNAHL